MTAYSKLWTKYSGKEFTHSEATKTLKEKKMVSVILSEMRKNGWLALRLDPQDSRKRLYKLISPNNALESIAKG